MRSRVEVAGAPVIPALRYRDAVAAIEWLCKAFGFEKHLVLAAEDGSIANAQLTFGSSMIMIGSVQEFGFGRLMRQPDEIGGAETQSCYLRVDNADSHYSKARQAGADIILDVADYEHGGRGYSCRDLEGHIWTFGTYDPWQGQTVLADAAPQKKASAKRQAALVAALSVAALACAVSAGVIYGEAQDTRRKLDAANAAQGASETGSQTAREMLARERAAREGAERFAKDTADRFAEARTVREATEQTARAALEQQGKERAARLVAEQAAARAHEQRQREQLGRQTAESALEKATEQLAALAQATAGAQAEAAEARTQLAAISAARLEAESFAKTAGDMLSVDCRSQAAADHTLLEAARAMPAETRQGQAIAASAPQTFEPGSTGIAAQLKQARDQLARERGAREHAESAARQAQDELAKARTAGKSGGRYDSLTTALLCQR